MTDRHLLVLDLDETLMFANELPLRRAPDHEVPPYFVYLRPGLRAFVDFALSVFDVAVWSSSSPAYADAMCALIFPDPKQLAFVWARDRCTPTRDRELDQWTHAKHLTKLRRRGYDLDRVLVVDDSPEKHRRNYGNLIPIAPFRGDQNDRELALLTGYLALLASKANLRGLEKRDWRSSLGG